MILDYLPDTNSIILIASVWTGIAVLLAVLVLLHKWLQVPQGEDWQASGVAVLESPLPTAEIELKYYPGEDVEWGELAEDFSFQEHAGGGGGGGGGGVQRFPEAPPTAPLVEAHAILDEEQRPVPVAVGSSGPELIKPPKAKRARTKKPRKAKPSNHEE